MTEWIFTFTQVQTHPETGMPLSHRFLRVRANDAEEARAKVVKYWGLKWGFQYDSEEEAEVKNYNMTELHQDDWPKPVTA